MPPKTVTRRCLHARMDTLLPEQRRTTATGAEQPLDLREGTEGSTAAAGVSFVLFADLRNHLRQEAACTGAPPKQSRDRQYGCGWCTVTAKAPSSFTHARMSGTSRHHPNSVLSATWSWPGTPVTRFQRRNWHRRRDLLKRQSESPARRNHPNWTVQELIG